MTSGQDRRQRAVMASDAEWERIARVAGSAGIKISRFIVHRPWSGPPNDGSGGYAWSTMSLSVTSVGGHLTRDPLRASPVEGPFF